MTRGRQYPDQILQRPNALAKLAKALSKGFLNFLKKFGDNQFFHYTLRNRKQYLHQGNKIGT